MRRSPIPLDLIFLAFLPGAYVISTGSLTWSLKAVAVLLIALYLCAHLLVADARRVWVYRLKLALLLGLLAVLVLAPAAMSMYARQQEGVHTNAHDGVIQVEEAVRFLLARENPYAVTYEDTPLALWRYARPFPNPALYNLVYLPFMFLIGLPAYGLSMVTLGWYDQRVVYLAALLVALWCFWSLARDRVSGLIIIMVLALHPLTTPFLVEGRNDILVVALIGLSLWLLGRRGWCYEASGVAYGLACASKHTAWFLMPFMLLYLLRRADISGVRPGGRVDSPLIYKWALPAGLTAGAIVLPFFLWTPARFLESTLFFLLGTAEHSYPIPDDAYGLHTVLSTPGVWEWLDRVSSGPLAFLRPLTDALQIRSPGESFPFWLLQALFALPVFAVALRRQYRHNTTAAALSGYGVTLLTVGYLSRYFHSNHIGYAVTMIALAYLIREPLPDVEQVEAPRATPSAIPSRAPSSG